MARFEDIGKNNIDIAGGKGANLGEMTQAGIPVPPGFVITSKTYDIFMTNTGLYKKVYKLLDGIDVNETKKLQKVAEKIKQLIIETEIPNELSTLISESYNALGIKVGHDDVEVAIRSSATAEDLPEASFAGQQDTFLHIKGAEQVVEYVRKCWASLFEARAIFYREENNFDHSKVYIAVVVQEMVESEKAGVMFTVNPSTGEDVALIEGSWGLGESVVSGSVTPDTYNVDKKTNKLLNVTIGDKKTMYVKDKGGNTIIKDVPDSMKKQRVLSDEELTELNEMGKRIQSHYGAPQDTEWAFHKDTLYMLQSRPITTLNDVSDSSVGSGENELENRTVVVSGLGASPGFGSGEVKIINNIDELDKIKDGDIMVTIMTTPDMVPAMKRANAIITDEGGITCHAAIISRELGIPCVVGTGDASEILVEDSKVTVDGKRGSIYEGIFAVDNNQDNTNLSTTTNAQTDIITVTEVKVNVSMPEAAPKAAATGADGVGLLRTEHMMLTDGVHPKKFIVDDNEDELVKILVENIIKVVDLFHPKPVWYRTLDAPTDEFITLKGGENEPHEHNPMLGWRGIRRELDEPDILRAEFKAVKTLLDKGYDNIGVMLPLVQHPNELKHAKEIATEVGLVPHKDVDFGIMVEIPAAAITIEDFIDVGLDFISFGTNDLTQYSLAVDRNNELVAAHYNEEHPAIMKLIKYAIKKCNAAGVKTSICGQAGSVPHIVEKLVEFGITSVSANTDAVEAVRKTVARAEQKLILNAARASLNNDDDDLFD
ncbi:phosphoenolpyruvate synthase [Methanobrevibacter curvatus]|uniref:Phosphoenolpyruvate synthase n=1 Tax=Methanobrevibacter curvatus TaxID=49547 RepID=A0A165ZU15_9EURY|nr:phosphoenolpyruvate synthase [Methanobrevibacter curvatus]